MLRHQQQISRLDHTSFRVYCSAGWKNAERDIELCPRSSQPASLLPSADGMQQKVQSRSSSILSRILQSARCNTLLIVMPHENGHGSMAVIKEPGMMAANVPNCGTLKNMMLSSTQMHAGAHARNMGHMQSSALLNWQGVGPSRKQNQRRMLLLPRSN